MFNYSQYNGTPINEITHEEFEVQSQQGRETWKSGAIGIRDRLSKIQPAKPAKPATPKKQPVKKAKTVVQLTRTVEKPAPPLAAAKPAKKQKPKKSLTRQEYVLRKFPPVMTEEEEA